MSEMAHLGTKEFHRQVKLAGVLVAIGIVFGDIGTSPLYTYNAIFHEGEIIAPEKALGVLSCVFWTLTLQTTLKYILITLQADNNGEGGIFSLYALIRKYFGKWIIVLAVVGGSFMVADGIITPPISVASAIEGLQGVYPNINTVPIVIGIIILLFAIQQFGTQQIGKLFGPVMVVWFTFIGVIGALSLSHDITVLRALNPYYAYNLLVNYPRGFWLLGGIFLCTTGAEALYSDMGHCGRNNIRLGWLYIKITLVLSYAGQTAWLLHAGKANNLSPFFNTVPRAIYLPSVILASFATVIASQALISGCFTLAYEAIRLGLWPRHKVIFPSTIKGQLYLPFFNWTLMIACLGAVVYFRESRNMEAAFGLSVTITMLITTFLITCYMVIRRRPLVLTFLVAAVFLSVETSFLVANIQKLKEGGWIMLVVGGVLTSIMLIWHRGKATQQGLVKVTSLDRDTVAQLVDLSHNDGIANYSSNLIYLTALDRPGQVEKKVLNSILNSPAKKADVYWFFHVHITDAPFTTEYEVHTISPNDAYHVIVHLGFRVEVRLDLFFRKIVEELLESKELTFENYAGREYSADQIGDYKFVITNSFLSYDNKLPFWKNIFTRAYYGLKAVGVKEDVNYGLDRSNVIFEKYPLVYSQVENVTLSRINRRING
jgi:KUP system potassium uptake protein